MARRGRPPRKTVDATNVEDPVLNQAEGRVVPDGPQGFVDKEETGLIIKTSGPSLSDLNQSFINDVSPERAAQMVSEKGQWVKIEPRVAAIYVPDYASGPASRMIGGEIHRYYRPKRIHAEIFNTKTRTLEEEATSAWIPEWEYTKLEEKAKGSVRVVERSHAAAS